MYCTYIHMHRLGTYVYHSAIPGKLTTGLIKCSTYWKWRQGES